MRFWAASWTRARMRFFSSMDAVVITFVVSFLLWPIYRQHLAVRMRLAAVLRQVIRVLDKLAAGLEDDEWQDDESASAQQFSQLLDGGTLDYLEAMPQLPSPPTHILQRSESRLSGTASREDRNDGRLLHNTRNLRPLTPRSDQQYGAHLLPQFMTDSLERLRPFIDSHLMLGWDWQLLHLAAAAGRTDVASYLCVDCHLSIALRNRKGRNVVAAAIDHGRVDFVRWALHGDAAELGARGRDNGRMTLFQAQLQLARSPDHVHNNQPPLLSAARRLDLPLLRALLNAEGEKEKSGIVWLLRYENVEQAVRIVQRHPTHGRTLPRRKNQALQLLLRALRETDIDPHEAAKEHSPFSSWSQSRFHADGTVPTDAETLSSIQSALPKCIWARVSRDVLPWSPSELKKLYILLIEFVEAGYVGCARWLVDHWDVKLRPPPGIRQDLVLADNVLGRHEHFMDEVRAIKEPTAGDEIGQMQRLQLLQNWDGRSAASLAEALESDLDDVWTRLERQQEEGKRDTSHLYQSSLTAMRHFTVLVSGCGRTGRSYSCKRTVYADERPHMLDFLTARLGMSGVPQLKMILCSGLIWPLRWLIEKSWLCLDAPMGGTTRAPQQEGDHCPVCLSPFTAPVALACGHELCRMCARRLWRSGDAPVEENRPCPMCRTMVPSPATVPTDLVAVLADELDSEFAPWMRLPSDDSSWLTTTVPTGNVVAALAARIGAVAVIEFVAQHQPPIDLGYVFGDASTLMHFAASARKPAVVKWLLANGYGTTMATQRDAQGCLPLHCAMRSGDVFTCRLLLSQPDAYPPAAIYGSDLEGEGGWVDELLSSPHEKVRDFGREHLQAVASRCAMETMKRIISVGGTLDAVVEIEESLEHALDKRIERDLFRDRNDDAPSLTYEDVKGQDPLAEIVEVATAAGRVDIVRWLFSERRKFWHSFRLTQNLIPRYEYDENHERITPTYEEFGRRAAASNGRPEFNELYDLLRLNEEATLAVWQQSSDLRQKIAAGATVSEIEAASALVIATRSQIPDDLISDRRSEVGLSCLLAQRSATHFDQRIDGYGSFTVLNMITILGHVHLLDWLLTMPGVVGVDEGLDMLKRSVACSDASEESATVQQRLVAWLGEKHNYTDFSRLFVLRNTDHDDSERNLSDAEKRKRRSTNLPDSFYSKMVSLLDAAVDRLLSTLSYDQKSADHLGRIWASIELLVALQPPIPCALEAHVEFLKRNYSFLSSSKDPHEDFIAYRTRCEAHILRLLQLFAARGHDLSAPVLLEGVYSPTYVSRILLDGGWISCLEWLVLERHPDINVQSYKMMEERMTGWEDAKKEWYALNQRKLAAIRAAQRERWRAVGGPRELLYQ